MITSQDRSCGMGLRQEGGVRWGSEVPLRIYSPRTHKPAFVGQGLEPKGEAFLRPQVRELGLRGSLLHAVPVP